MKLSAPRILSLLENAELAALEAGELEEVHLYDIDATKTNVLALLVDGVVIEKCSY